MKKGGLGISIIVPIYNVEEYLDECISSILAQTSNKYEIILVNDGSTDDSKVIAQRYADSFNNIILVNKKNGGLSSARNEGLKYARNNYVLFLDSDDCLKNNAIEELIKRLEYSNEEVLLFEAECFDESGILNNDWYVRKFEEGLIVSGKEYLKKTVNNFIPSACMMAVKKTVLEHNHIKFVEGIIHEDNPFFYEVMYVSNRVSVIKKALYWRRIRRGSITTNYDYLSGMKGYIITIKEIERFLDEYNDKINIEYLRIWSTIIIDCYYELNLSKKIEARELMNLFSMMMKENNYLYGKKMKLFCKCKMAYIVLRKVGIF